MSQSTYLAGISCLCCGKTLGVTTEIDKDPLTLGSEMKLRYIAIEVHDYKTSQSFSVEGFICDECYNNRIRDLFLSFL